ncbi:MAG: hypothetical protein ACRDKG_00570 [Actinomycetota bacterium]
MPESASFSVRRPNYRRRRTFTVLGLLAVVVLAAVLLTRGGDGGPGDRPIPTLQFVPTAKHIFQGKAAAPAVQQGEVQAITTMFSDFYQEAFVDPEKWGDGTFEDLAGLFTDDAKASFTRDLASLTIGAARTELERVDLGTGNTLAVTVYYDSKQKPTFAVTAVAFDGRGTLKESGPAVTIKQRATYYLQKLGSDWKITAFDANETQTTPTPTPTASAT